VISDRVAARADANGEGLLLAFRDTGSTALHPGRAEFALAAALSAMFYLYATGSPIAYMLDDDFASADELFAAGATFTLLVWAFAYLYRVCQALLPGSFGALATRGMADVQPTCLHSEG